MTRLRFISLPKCASGDKSFSWSNGKAGENSAKMRRISAVARTRYLLIALLGIGLSAGFFLTPVRAEAAVSPVPPALRSQLESLYSAWRIAMAQSDLRGWVRNTARARQISVRNSIVSQKREWPRSLFSLVIVPPEVAALRLAGSEVKGDQARLVYYGTVDFSLQAGTKPPENAFMLDFVKEETGWKFLIGRYYNLENDPELRREVAEGNIQKLYGPEDMLTGTPPPLPLTCPVPDYVGQLEIHSHGYATKVTLGDYHRSTIVSESRTETILGGLKKGATTLQMEIVPLDDVPAADRVFHVRVHAITPQLRTASVCVLEYKPEGAPPATSGHIINVGPSTLRKGNEIELRMDQ
jgi:hypothetical protein